MSWKVESEGMGLLGYHLTVSERPHFPGNKPMFGWVVYSVDDDGGSASGTCDSRTKAMEAAEEMARCLAKHRV